MAKPQKLPSGAWRIQWHDSAGRRRSEVFASEAAARAGLRRRQVETDDIRAGRARPRSSQTLAEAAKEWLPIRPPARRKDDTGNLEIHILPVLGSRALPSITPAVINQFTRALEIKKTARKGERNKAGRTLRPATIRNILRTLGKLLGDMDYPVRIRYRVPESDYEWLRTEADVAKFIAACQPDWLRMAAEISLYAGLRKGEIAGLRRDAIDFERQLIRVDRTYEGRPTKSKHVRFAPLPAALAASLKRWMLAHKGPLVVTRNGRPIEEDDDVAAAVRRACKKAGVNSINFHQLRHTSASHLAQRVPLPIVGAVLGHASPSTTARYAHLDSESLARSPRLHLDFTAPAGVVENFPVGLASSVASSVVSPLGPPGRRA